MWSDYRNASLGVWTLLSERNLPSNAHFSQGKEPLPDHANLRQRHTSQSRQTTPSSLDTLSKRCCTTADHVAPRQGHVNTTSRLLSTPQQSRSTVTQSATADQGFPLVPYSENTSGLESGPSELHMPLDIVPAAVDTIFQSLWSFRFPLLN